MPPSADFLEEPAIFTHKPLVVMNSCPKHLEIFITVSPGCKQIVNEESRMEEGNQRQE